MSAAFDMIIAIDLGRYKNVAGVYSRTTRVHTFHTFHTFHTLDTTPTDLDRLLARHHGSLVVIQACAKAGWVDDHAVAAGQLLDRFDAPRRRFGRFDKVSRARGSGHVTHIVPNGPDLV